MGRFRTRRLAAVDMHGRAGARWRRRVILAEFWVGAALAAGLGIVSLASGGLVPRLMGLWLIGVFANYLPLAVHATSLSRSGALESELAGADIGAELRYYGVAQLWLLVPFAVAAVTLGQLGRVGRAGRAGGR